MPDNTAPGTALSSKTPTGRLRFVAGRLQQQWETFYHPEYIEIGGKIVPKSKAPTLEWQDVPSMDADNA